ncbi:MAG: 2-oxoglutarate dehydrogenase E1 component [Gammaproteobacteria bacterium]|nr:2-oxoglutarate dehydrogenase E1 component [Gammaproteobacteria bacterium]
MSDATVLSPANAAYLDAIYQSYLHDPGSVEPSWRDYFKSLPTTVAAQSKASVSKSLAGNGALPENRSALTEKQSAVLTYIGAVRYRGHCQADLDPLGLTKRPYIPDLALDYHKLTDEDLDVIFNTGSLFTEPEAPLREIKQLLEETYCGSVGAEFMHITSTASKRWLQQRLEAARGRPSYDADKKKDILRWLTAGRKLEEYLHTKYVGQKRFSLEGGESLIPLLDEIIQRSGANGVKEIVVGMAHRGRLNVLVNIYGKHPRVLFGEFEGKIDVGSGSGDVKYHLGFSSDVATPGGPVHLVLAFNPSHLEIINPVVEGSCRARQERRADSDGAQVLPVLVHGDAAFAGQGVVMETLNLAATRGYGTGGTIHVVVNNQIGFTTSDPADSRSTLYCTDVAKLVEAPIFHVNGNDPEAVTFVTELAVAYRMEFKRDVVIDMLCYRRHGHNEADEPLVTQPMMYQRIRNQKGVRRLYAERLEREGVIEAGQADRLAEQYIQSLEDNQVVSRPLTVNPATAHLVNWAPHLSDAWDEPCDSGISLERIRRLGARLSTYPEHFEIHRTVRRIMDARVAMSGGTKPIDWGFAESLAYASLLEDGYSVRLSGQDSERGTFSHRHATLHNQKERGTYQPLRHLFEGQPSFRVINSVLSEEAVLAFEYGFSTAEPECLTLWEAQFGDFANGAQVVIDQFLSSSEAKWGRHCGLVLLLPHGYEGQGPEHSSARLERYLQLCAEDNIQVCVPSTPAQLFHMLRRQMLRAFRKPLVIMSPKSLLRHRNCVSTREELIQGRFQVVMDDVEGGLPPAAVTRLVLCSGKVYYDLIEKRRELGIPKHIAIVRIEQLYPFPKTAIQAILDRYAEAKDVVWCQEEPRNQGSWFFMLSRRHLAGMVADRQLHYAGREYSASPAAGYLNVHHEQQRALVQDAFGIDAEQDKKSAATPKT